MQFFSYIQLSSFPVGLLTSNFPACPSPGTSEKCLTFLCSAISLQMMEDCNECPLYPSPLNRPYFFNLSTQAICSSLHHDPTEVTPEGWLLVPREPRTMHSYPRCLSETLEQRAGTFLNLLAKPWLRQPQVWLAFPNQHVAGSAQAVATGTFRCCSPELLCSHSKAPARSAPMHNSEFAAPELVEVPSSALVFLSFLRNEV